MKYKQIFNECTQNLTKIKEAPTVEKINKWWGESIGKR
jgi:hypothetical protein